MKPKVVFSNVSKKYSLYKKKSDKLLQLLLNKKNNQTFYALNNISFEVLEGETIGIIGTNGSGKSTLSNLLAGVIPPTDGTIETNGETSLIAINVGLNVNITGLENIELKCLMHGLDKKTIKELTPNIIEFADIGDFIDQPVKNYSSGMKSRLGFAISVHTEPDILIVDEALSVGDQTFYEKCLNKINEFKAKGKTIFFISHSISQIKNISDRVLWLSFGEVQEFGEPTMVINKYNNYINWFNKLSVKEQREFKQKKLFDQRQDKSISNLPRSSRERKQTKAKKSNFLLNAQIISLLVITFIFGLLMFNNGTIHISALFKKPDTQTTYKSVQKQPVENNLINKQGSVRANTTNVYLDLDQSNMIGALSFSTQVFVTAEYEDLYEIKYKNEKSYVSKQDVDLIDINKLENGDLELADITSTFPERFRRSYQFFLSQFGRPFDEIKNDLGGLSGESVDESGNKRLEYSYDNVSIVFNESELVNIFIIDHIKVDPSLQQTLMEKSQLQSEDQSLYYIKSDDYIYIFDVVNNTLTLQES